MLRQSSKGWLGTFLLSTAAVTLIAAGSVSASRSRVATRSQLASLPTLPTIQAGGKVAHARPRRLARATTSLYEHSVRRRVLRRR